MGITISLLVDMVHSKTWGEGGLSWTFCIQRVFRSDCMFPHSSQDRCRHVFTCWLIKYLAFSWMTATSHVPILIWVIYSDSSFPASEDETRAPTLASTITVKCKTSINRDINRNMTDNPTQEVFVWLIMEENTLFFISAACCSLLCWLPTPNRVHVKNNTLSFKEISQASYNDLTSEAVQI